MPRYYFDVRDTQGTERDDEGVVLNSMDDAIREAQRALRDMIDDTQPFHALAEIHLAIEIRDHEEGPYLLSVTFSSDWKR